MSNMTPGMHTPTRPQRHRPARRILVTAVLLATLHLAPSAVAVDRTVSQYAIDLGWDVRHLALKESVELLHRTFVADRMKRGDGHHAVALVVVILVDVEQASSSVLYGAEEIDLTEEIIKAYNNAK